ncbi:MAG TPA: prephenate dehydratase [Actinomycetospora sp.]|uniref:prephenate dehydratase n=1 Tax=Actinomycetospora sp. TaxID=1872135 RepID=UPI002F42B5EE
MTSGHVAYLGPPGTFCEQALRSLVEAPGSAFTGAVPRAAASTTAALDLLRAGEVELACVPIENSVEGAVPATMDGLVESPPVVVVREILLPVRFAVLVRPGTTRADVRTVASHPHGEAQTSRWLATHLPAAETRMTPSTAAAAAAVADGQVDAAVCAPVAARHYGLEALADGVHDTGDAVTRFVVVAPAGVRLPAATGSDRTSIAATTVNEPGALLAILTEFAIRGVDLTRIESRPSKERLGTYWFFLDGAGHVGEPAMGEALAALHRRCTDLRFLGSYPRARVPAGSTAPSPPVAPPVPGQEGADYDAAARWLTALREVPGEALPG